MFFFCFLGPNWQHMEIPRLGVESELQLPAYAIATATWDPSRVSDLHHSSLQCWLLNPLSEAKNGTHILVDTSRVLNPLNPSGNSTQWVFKANILAQNGHRMVRESLLIGVPSSLN